MNKEIRNTRRPLRRLRVPADAAVAFKEEIDIATGRHVRPRKLTIEVPLADDENWMALCEKIWRARR